MNDFKQQLKTLILEESDKLDEIELEDFADDMALFGRNSPLALDSLDALQISMAIQKQYGVRLEGAGMVRKHMQTVNALAEFIEQQNI